MIELIQLFSLALLGSIVALLGGVVFLYKKNWSATLERHSVSFAAGVLLVVAMVGLLPESVEMIGHKAFWVVLIVFIAAYLFEHIFCGLHHHESHQHGREYKSAVPLVIIGDTIHNLIDGVAIGASFFVNPGLGLITAISTFLHEVPHEIGDFGILLKAGWDRKKIIWVNIASASMTIVGAFLILLFVESQVVLGTLMGVSAGIFLYLASSDFLPAIEVNGQNKLRSLLPLLIGVAIMMITLAVIPHSHEH